MFARESEDKDSGKHLSLNHLWMEWSAVPPAIDSAPTTTMILLFEHPAAGPVRKWKNVLRFSKARSLRRLLHGLFWMREHPINPSAGS
jgi:hypothetical protein